MTKNPMHNEDVELVLQKDCEEWDPDDMQNLIRYMRDMRKKFLVVEEKKAEKKAQKEMTADEILAEALKETL